MNSSDPLAGSKRRLARAKTHIRDLNLTVKAFVDRKPYRHVVEPAPDGIHDIHKLKARRKALPTSFVDLTTDATENLRAALDLAIYAVAAKCPAANLGRAAFPFCAKLTDFPSRIGDSCKGFPNELLTLLAAFQPYQGGNDTLWALNEICRISKHQRITTVAFQIIAAHVESMIGFGNFQIPPQWDMANNEFVIGWTRPNTHVKYNMTAAFTIGLDDVEIVRGKPLVGVLYQMTRIVEGIIMAIEAEAKRVGLFSSGLHSK